MSTSSPTVPVETARHGSGRRVTPTGRLVLPADAPREEWLAARTQGVGSSDVPAILGVSDFSSPLHVYYDKRGELPDDAGEPAYWGTVLEEPVARDWARRNRSVVRRVGLVQHQDQPWMRCTLDRRVTECPLPGSGSREACALEVKTRSAFKAARWHAGAPDDVLAQVLWQMAVTGYEHMHYAVLIGGNEYRQGTIRAADYPQVMADIVTGVERFWTSHVLAEAPPEASGNPERTADMYRRMHPDRADEAVLVAGDAMAAFDALHDYETHRLAEAAAKKLKEAAKAELLRLLGSHQTAVLADEPAYSLKPGQRAKPDLGRLAERWPDAYADCVTHTPTERLDIAKAHRLTANGA